MDLRLRSLNFSKPSGGIYEGIRGIKAGDKNIQNECVEMSSEPDCAIIQSQRSHSRKNLTLTVLLRE